MRFKVFDTEGSSIYLEFVPENETDFFDTGVIYQKLGGTISFSNTDDPNGKFGVDSISVPIKKLVEFITRIS